MHATVTPYRIEVNHESVAVYDTTNHTPALVAVFTRTDAVRLAEDILAGTTTGDGPDDSDSQLEFTFAMADEAAQREAVGA